MTEHTGSSVLFAIFILSIYSLVLFPYTFYKLFTKSGDDVVQTWQHKAKKGKSNLGDKLKRMFSTGNLVLLGLWVIWAGLLYYISVSSKEMKQFDPYEILGLPRGASMAEVKRAYRELSRIYHPDKNKDPKAAEYFAGSLSKAHAALTDDVARENWEKYGHPDGPQSLSVSVALPELFFTKDKNLAPIMLLGLIGFGVLLPLTLVSWHMLNANKFLGPNRIANETLFFYTHYKTCVKESQSLVRIPETLLCAREFIDLPTPASHAQPMEELRKIVTTCSPDLKEKKAFWQRKGSVVKAHMLLLAYLERESDSISPVLQADLKYVLQKTPLLLEEIVKVAAIRRPPHGCGWMTPAVAGVEMLQCVAQAVPTEMKRPQAKTADNLAPLLQLPHLDAEICRKLRRKRVTSLKDLQSLSDKECEEVLMSVDLNASQIEDVRTLLSALPKLYVKAHFELDGEFEIMERDVPTIKIRAVLTRPSHAGAGKIKASGKAVRGYTPQYPLPRDESWYFMLADPAANALLAHTKATLLEAEAIGYAEPTAGEALMGGTQSRSTAESKASNNRNGNVSNGEVNSYIGVNAVANGTLHDTNDAKDVEEKGQLVEMVFPPLKAGKYDLVLICMPDCYMGCDESIPLKLKVLPLSKQVVESREERSKSKGAVKWDSEDEQSGSDENSDNEGGDSEEDDDDYDSEESGEEETDEDEQANEDSNSTFDEIKKDR